MIVNHDQRNGWQAERWAENIPRFQQRIIQPADGDRFLMQQFVSGVKVKADGMFACFSADVADMLQYMMGIFNLFFIWLLVSFAQFQRGQDLSRFSDP